MKIYTYKQEEQIKELQSQISWMEEDLQSLKEQLNDLLDD